MGAANPSQRVSFLISLCQILAKLSTLYGFGDLKSVSVTFLLHVTLLILYREHAKTVNTSYCFQVLLEDRKTNRLQEAR